MIRVVTFGPTKIWLFIQQLHRHDHDDNNNFVPAAQYLCYYKFSEPTLMLFGELLREEHAGHPLLFASSDEAEKYATDFLRKKYYQTR